MHRSSGIGTILQNTLPRLARLQPEVCWVLLCNGDSMEGDAVLQLPNVSWIDCRAPIYSISEQLELLRKIPKDTSLFWSPNFNIPVLYRGPMAVLICDAFHLANPQWVGGLHRRMYARFIFNRIRLMARRIMTISEFSKSELIRLAHFDPRKIHVVHCGLDRAWLDVRRAQPPHPRPYFLYVGNVKPHKNLGKLVEAMNHIKDRVEHDLVIVGKMEGFLTGDRALLNRAPSILGDRLKFTGKVDFPLLQQYYANAEALVLPSYYEGFGLPPVEAMASGIPAIVSNRASLPEVCGDAALYVDPADYRSIALAMIKVIEDPEVRAQLVLRGRERAKQFTWEAATSQSWEFLRQALSS